MMTIRKMLLCIATATLTTSATARPLDAIGNCPGGGTLSFANGLYKGSAKSMKSLPDFMQIHTAATAQEAYWIKNLSGLSGRNRIYTSPTQQIVVITHCNPADCEHNRAYIVYEPATGQYGGSYYEGQPTREFGTTPDSSRYPKQLGTALTCAKNLDWGN
jgi:Inhibitor of vertebrate lysozyme (Ivy)